MHVVLAQFSALLFQAYFILIVLDLIPMHVLLTKGVKGNIIVKRDKSALYNDAKFILCSVV